MTFNKDGIMLLTSVGAHTGAPILLSVGDGGTVALNTSTSLSYSITGTRTIKNTDSVAGTYIFIKASL